MLKYLKIEVQLKDYETKILYVNSFKKRKRDIPDFEQAKRRILKLFPNVKKMVWLNEYELTKKV